MNVIVCLHPQRGSRPSGLRGLAGADAGLWHESVLSRPAHRGRGRQPVASRSELHAEASRLVRHGSPNPATRRRRKARRASCRDRRPRDRVESRSRPGSRRRRLGSADSRTGARRRGDRGRLRSPSQMKRLVRVASWPAVSRRRRHPLQRGRPGRTSASSTGILRRLGVRFFLSISASPVDRASKHARPQRAEAQRAGRHTRHRRSRPASCRPRPLRRVTASKNRVGAV